MLIQASWHVNTKVKRRVNNYAQSLTCVHLTHIELLAFSLHSSENKSTSQLPSGQRWTTPAEQRDKSHPFELANTPMPKIHGQKEQDRICIKMIYLERMQAELEHSHLTHKTHRRENGFNIWLGDQDWKHLIASIMSLSYPPDEMFFFTSLPKPLCKVNRILKTFLEKKLFIFKIACSLQLMQIRLTVQICSIHNNTTPHKIFA